MKGHDSVDVAVHFVVAVVLCIVFGTWGFIIWELGLNQVVSALMTG